MTNARLLKFMPAAALAAGLACSPASAQSLLGGANAGVAAGGGHAGAAVGGNAGLATGGGAVGAPTAGFGRGGGAGAPALAAPHVNQAPVAVPRAQVPGAAVGGGYAGGYAGGGHRRAGGMPGTNGWSAGAPAVQQRHVWQGRNNPNYAPRSGWQGAGHHHRGHWRGGVWVPYVVGTYDYYPSYGVYDDEDCVLRKVRVHTRNGWKRVWRRICS